ncbi:hypothetical protein GTC6_07169 [Gordonia terrae C-6]|uniref:Uncharacterized protein n=1 Tax=Gordonia terrae C-6 TaxID=1316928 RepID=R7YC18_9ACTN|nr:hypothetical protein GTC6_07169 [Gordonia terrae C-6]
MARTWLSVTVELLGGRGIELWPCPGGVFAVGPAHTFADLATAVDDAFARWDRSHLSLFTLDDGRVVADAALGADMAGGIGGPISEPVDIATARHIAPGDRVEKSIRVRGRDRPTYLAQATHSSRSAPGCRWHCRSAASEPNRWPCRSSNNSTDGESPATPNSPRNYSRSCAENPRRDGRSRWISRCSATRWRVIRAGRPAAIST